MSLLLALLLFAVPVAAFWSLLPVLDPIGRLIVAIAGGIAAVAAVAQVMIMMGAWSPGGGVAGVLALSAAVAGLGAAHRRRRPAPPDPAPPATSRADVTRADIPVQRLDEDEEEWLFRD
ncbi:hypothetical protein [Actinomadura parmotrematis]|uniref:Uncharacterized protein n=1 Tax=Actinomadura parmotrematis TaxID=2864039 RepID=A0ABS7FVK5_9ACTN|nr:hypothetical protein [Actinomadura parmotrematis]MBW8484454.1 hypothetical protein [Actinomadura parmotrematis]